MQEEYKKLDDLRVQIAANAYRAEILFRTIINYEAHREVTTLSELGEETCKQIREYTEDIEFTLDRIKHFKA